MRILILGGSGFLGSHVADRFLAEGHDVVVYDRSTERFRRPSALLHHVSGDLQNSGALEEVVATGFDAVLHFISTTTPKSSNESPEFDIQSNVIASVNLLDICVRHKVGKFVFLSSGGTVYGNVGEADRVDETHPVRPICSYGISKLSIEHYLNLYEYLYGLNSVTLRIANPYGERQSPHASLGALTVFLHRTLRGQTIEIWGDGRVTRDFIYAGDVADAVYLATISPISGVFNVGSGRGYSLRELVREISSSVGIEPKIVWLKARAFDVPKVVLDSSKLNRATGWACKTSLAQGIALTADWLKSANF
jgi:UDP-glucose 4-epimerase